MTIFGDIGTVIFVDDDEALRAANVQSLKLAGLEVSPYPSAREALRDIDRDFAGAIVSDIRMPDIDGLQFFRELNAIDPEIPVILITGHGDVPMAVAALKEGVHDFLTKPFASDHLIASVTRALELRWLVLENRRLRIAADEAGRGTPLVGETPAMVRLRETIAQVAQADIDVLIEGETGTGKELVAVMLHRAGPRRKREFVAVNFGALPEAVAEAELLGEKYGPGSAGRTGRMESANSGTLFLDEIESAALPLQARILRVIEEREVLPVGGKEPRPINIRVIAASRRDLQSAVAEGSFREDLFYRLGMVRLRIPPLRERRADIPLLFAHFSAEAARELGQPAPVLTDSIRRHLLEHDWPGNIRELRSFAVRATLGLDEDFGRVEGGTGARVSLPERMERFEESIIRETLAGCQGKVQAVLERLDIPRKTFYDKLNRHRIDINSYRKR